LVRNPIMLANARPIHTTQGLLRFGVLKSWAGDAICGETTALLSI
jgi:hypothetical protein